MCVDRVRDFEFTGELCIFDLLGIMLYHGWVVDPGSEAAPIITSLSYNQLTNNIFAWKEEAIRDNNNDLLMKGTVCKNYEGADDNLSSLRANDSSRLIDIGVHLYERSISWINCGESDSTTLQFDK